MTPYPMSKIDLAQEQLDGAVWLLFSRRNYVGAFSLTMSAYEVIFDLLKHAGRDSFWKTADEYCLPAGKGLIRKRGRALWAKMKHADRDPAGIERWSPLFGQDLEDARKHGGKRERNALEEGGRA